MEQENWKDIIGYEGRYQVSNLGNIKSLNYNHKNLQKKLKTGLTTKGYRQVGLYNNGVRITFRVNRLVAKHFIPNPENKPQVNHKDGNKLNDKVSNLEWCTASENIVHSWRNGLSSMVGRSKSVLQYDLKGNLLNEYSSLSDASRNTEYSLAHISRICHDPKIQSKYVFRFKFN